MDIKRLIVILCMIGIFIILGVIVLIVKISDDNNIFISPSKIHGIQSLRYAYSTGNMVYSSVIYEMKCNDNNKCTIFIKPSGTPERDAKTYDMTDEDVKKVIEVLNKYEVLKWDGFKKRDSMVLDGNSFSFNLKTSDKKEVIASGYMKWPKNYFEVRDELRNIFYNYLEE